MMLMRANSRTTGRGSCWSALTSMSHGPAVPIPSTRTWSYAKWRGLHGSSPRIEAGDGRLRWASIQETVLHAGLKRAAADLDLEVRAFGAGHGDPYYAAAGAVD